MMRGESDESQASLRSLYTVQSVDALVDGSTSSQGPATIPKIAAKGGRRRQWRAMNSAYTHAVDDGDMTNSVLPTNYGFKAFRR
jgi:hypothetical protein